MQKFENIPHEGIDIKGDFIDCFCDHREIVRVAQPNYDDPFLDNPESEMDSMFCNKGYFCECNESECIYHFDRTDS